MFRVVVIAGLSLSLACSERPPPKAARQEERVPVNSFSERPETHAETTERPDPTRPDPTTRDESGDHAPTVVAQPDCDRMMDRYIDLEVAANPQLEGVPREVIEQAKTMAREQHGDVPCTATPSQYACAMAAKTTGAWQRCLR